MRFLLQSSGKEPLAIICEGSCAWKVLVLNNAARTFPMRKGAVDLARLLPKGLRIPLPRTLFVLLLASKMIPIVSVRMVAQEGRLPFQRLHLPREGQLLLAVQIIIAAAVRRIFFVFGAAPFARIRARGRVRIVRKTLLAAPQLPVSRIIFPAPPQRKLPDPHPRPRLPQLQPLRPTQGLLLPALQVR